MLFLQRNFLMTSQGRKRGRGRLGENVGRANLCENQNIAKLNAAQKTQISVQENPKIYTKNRHKNFRQSWTSCNFFQNYLQNAKICPKLFANITEKFLGWYMSSPRPLLCRKEKRASPWVTPVHTPTATPSHSRYHQLKNITSKIKIPLKRLFQGAQRHTGRSRNWTSRPICLPSDFTKRS